MIKVRATNASSVYKKRLAEFNRIVYEGEVFEVSEARYKVLHGDNRFGLVFVEKINDVTPKPAMTSAPEPVVNTVADFNTEQEPEIFVINPGEEPVAVDENLQPIKKKKKKSKKTTE